MTLDEAWKEAEAALPEGAWITASGSLKLGYNVVVYNMAPTSSMFGTAWEVARVPSGPLLPSLQALTAALRGRPEAETP